MITHFLPPSRSLLIALRLFPVLNLKWTFFFHYDQTTTRKQKVTGLLLAQQMASRTLLAGTTPHPDPMYSMRSWKPALPWAAELAGYGKGVCHSKSGCYRQRFSAASSPLWIEASPGGGITSQTHPSSHLTLPFLRASSLSEIKES